MLPQRSKLLETYISRRHDTEICSKRGETASRGIYNSCNTRSVDTPRTVIAPMKPKSMLMPKHKPRVVVAGSHPSTEEQNEEELDDGLDTPISPLSPPRPMLENFAWMDYYEAKHGI